MGVMFKFAVILSARSRVNLFRIALTQAFHSGFLDQFIVSSGFFHERTNKQGSFYASDAFINARLPNSAKVIVVGSYNPSSSEFESFYLQLKNHLMTKNGGVVPVSRRKAKKPWANKWHAKVFLARQQNKYRFAIVGSSNLTRSAFSHGSCNNETDVIIWDSAHASTNKMVEMCLDEVPEEFGPYNDGPNVFIGRYDPLDPLNRANLSMQRRLRMIWEDILQATRVV